MKVGLVIPCFDPNLGGAEQWTWQFAKGLAAGGHEVHVLAERFSAQAAQAPVIPHTIVNRGGRFNFGNAAAATLRSLCFDLVHDMGAGYCCDVFQPHGGSRRAAFEQNLRLRPAWLRPIKRRLARVLPRYRQFDRLMARQYASDGRILVAVSQMVARDFQHFHQVPSEQIRVVYNGVDCQRFSPDHRWEQREMVRRHLGLRDEVLLLIVAHNFALKGVPTLIRAVGRLLREGAPVRLAIAGGRRKFRYDQMVNFAKASNAVTFLGPVNDSAPYYAAADIYVQPTLYDPCSLVVLEAMASGLPVVTSQRNGAAELLTPGVEGEVIADPQDDAELADVLRPLLDQSRREGMGRSARQLALAHTLERNCQEVIEVYHERAGRRMAA